MNVRIFLFGLVFSFLLCTQVALAAGDTATLIVIKKNDRLLQLYSGQKVIAEYKVALGSEPQGKKHCQGDGKTPEGKYRIVSRNLHSAYHRSLRISYPNAEDQKAAAALKCNPGGDIMIHGLPPSFHYLGSAHRLHDWTAGCIAVTDDEIEAIWRLVKDGTPVEILP